MFASIQNRLLGYFVRRLLGHLLLRDRDNKTDLNIESSIINGSLTLNDIKLDPEALTQLLPAHLQNLFALLPIQDATVQTLHMTLGSRALHLTLTRPVIHLRLVSSSPITEFPLSTSSTDNNHGSDYDNGNDGNESSDSDSSVSFDPALSLAQSILEDDKTKMIGGAPPPFTEMPGEFSEVLRMAESSGYIDPNAIPAASSSSSTNDSNNSSENQPQQQEAGIVASILAMAAKKFALSLVEPLLVINAPDAPQPHSFHLSTKSFECKGPSISDNGKTFVSIHGLRFSYSPTPSIPPSSSPSFDINSQQQQEQQQQQSLSASSDESSNSNEINPEMTMSIADLREIDTRSASGKLSVPPPISEDMMASSTMSGADDDLFVSAHESEQQHLKESVKMDQNYVGSYNDKQDQASTSSATNNNKQHDQENLGNQLTLIWIDSDKPITISLPETNPVENDPQSSTTESTTETTATTSESSSDQDQNHSQGFQDDNNKSIDITVPPLCVNISLHTLDTIFQLIYIVTAHSKPHHHHHHHHQHHHHNQNRKKQKQPSPPLILNVDRLSLTLCASDDSIASDLNVDIFTLNVQCNDNENKLTVNDFTIYEYNRLTKKSSVILFSDKVAQPSSKYQNSNQPNLDHHSWASLPRVKDDSLLNLPFSNHALNLNSLDENSLELLCKSENDVVSIQSCLSPLHLYLNLDLLYNIGIILWIDKFDQLFSLSNKSNNDAVSSTEGSIFTLDSLSCAFLRLHLTCPSADSRSHIKPGLFTIDFYDLKHESSTSQSHQFSSTPTWPSSFQCNDPQSLNLHGITTINDLYMFYTAPQESLMKGFLRLSPINSSGLKIQSYNLENHQSSLLHHVALEKLNIEFEKSTFDELQIFLDNVFQFVEKFTLQQKSQSSINIISLTPPATSTSSRTSTPMSATVRSNTKKQPNPPKQSQSILDFALSLVEFKTRLMISKHAPTKVHGRKGSHSSTISSHKSSKPSMTLADHCANGLELGLSLNSLDEKNLTDLHLKLKDMKLWELTASGKQRHKQNGDIWSRRLLVSSDHSNQSDHHSLSSSNLLSLSFSSSSTPSFKKADVQLGIHGFFGVTDLNRDGLLANEVNTFIKPPPGVFETVPNDQTNIQLTIKNSSIQSNVSTSVHSQLCGVLVLGKLGLSTELNEHKPITGIDININDSGVLLSDNPPPFEDPFIPQVHLKVSKPSQRHAQITTFERQALQFESKDFAKILYFDHLNTRIGLADRKRKPELPETDIEFTSCKFNANFCADSFVSFNDFVGNLFGDGSKQENEKVESTRVDASTNEDGHVNTSELQHTLDHDESLTGSKHGSGKLDQSMMQSTLKSFSKSRRFKPEVISDIDDEKVTMYDSKGLLIKDDYVNTLTSELNEKPPITARKSRFSIKTCDAILNLHAGYDWSSTRKKISDETKAVRKRLNRIRQSLATGQGAQEYVPEEGSTTLFNSIHIGLPENADELDQEQLMTVIDDEISKTLDHVDDDVYGEAATNHPHEKKVHHEEPELIDDHKDGFDDEEFDGDDNWQALPRAPSQQSHGQASLYSQYSISPRSPDSRSNNPSIEIILVSASLLFETYDDDTKGEDIDELFRDYENVLRQVDFKFDKLEIVDHIKTSTWKTFLCELRTNDGGTPKPTGTPMGRIQTVVSKLVEEEVVPSSRSPEDVRLKVKFRPLRLHVDQDAVDFLKKFFSFQLDDNKVAKPDNTFIRRAEIFAVTIKLDYKPKRVDYQNIRKGKMIEFMNFFNFEASEMTLRQLTLTGITSWNRLFDMLQDIWTPDVKANQLSDVLSGISPVRSLVNVGAGMADLVLLPIEQYRRDGGVSRGIQKGASSFLKTTALEAVKFGARLATGTQVILERAETVFGESVNNNTFGSTGGGVGGSSGNRGDASATVVRETGEQLSKWASQPTDVKEGIGMAYTSLTGNLRSAAQTIIAVPVEVMDRSGPGRDGPTRSVVKAVPIAVLKPMIGTSEAVGKTLLGLRNTLDPNAQQENTEKYKQDHGPSTSSRRS